MWDYCGMARNEQGLKTALEKIPALREEFWQDVRVLGDDEEVNQSLEKAGRVADFLELGELHLPRCPGAPRIVRRPLPRGIPDRGRRGRPRRRALLPRRGLGVRRRGQPADPPHRAAGLRVRPLPDPELQIRPKVASSERTIRWPEAVKKRKINLTLNVWRQKDRNSAGRFVTYEARDISTDMSFLEMLDVVNERLISRARSRSPSTTTAARGSAGSAGS